jgi:CRISPR-associated protein Cas2
LTASYILPFSFSYFFELFLRKAKFGLGMLVLITYDVNVETSEGRRRLRRIAKICVNHGQRVQNSVFECQVDPAMLVKLRALLESEMNCATDSLRIYHLGKNWQGKVEHIGAKPGYDPDGPLIV